MSLTEVFYFFLSRVRIMWKKYNSGYHNHYQNKEGDICEWCAPLPWTKSFYLTMYQGSYSPEDNESLIISTGQLYTFVTVKGVPSCWAVWFHESTKPKNHMIFRQPCSPTKKSDYIVQKANNRVSIAQQN